MPDPIEKISESRWARRVLAAHPALENEVRAPARFTRSEMLNALAAAGDDAALSRELRTLRTRVLLRVMARDLSGMADLDEVCQTMSDLAEVAIQKAEPGLVVVGMGKLGGRELNVSSDIDLVF